MTKTLKTSSRAKIRILAVNAGVSLAGKSDVEVAEWACNNGHNDVIVWDDGTVGLAQETKVVVKQDGSLETALATAIKMAVADVMDQVELNAKLDEQKIIDLVKQYSVAPTVIEIRDTVKGTVKTIARAHKRMAKVLRYIRLGLNVYLPGPAGSGKTTLAFQVGEALGRPVYFDAKVSQEHKLAGYEDAGGVYHTTPFREAFEKGGVYLADEIDAWSAAASVWLNAAIANRKASFADKMVDAHPDFVFIGAGNTVGRGADRQYVGRNQLDAATLNRFVYVTVDYDEELEVALATEAYLNAGGQDESAARNWVKMVQKIRRNVEENGIRHIVSPRQSMMGAAALADGVELEEVLEDIVYQGLPEDVIAQIRP